MSITFYASGDEPRNYIDGPNFANGNAAMILRSLGYRGVESTFSTDLDDFEGRIILAREVGGSIEDGGQPTLDTGGPGTGRARMIDCGVRPGYFADAYERLADLCVEARVRGMHEIYGA